MSDRDGGPFRFGGAVTGEHLVDREEERAACVGALCGAGKVFLVGPRRYGKTSILASAHSAAESLGTPVLRYDLQAFTSLESFLGTLVTDGARALTGGVEQFGKVVVRFFARLRPEVSYDPAQGTCSVSLGLGGVAAAERAPRLAEVLDGLERMAAESDRHIGVVLDEFQEVLVLGGERAEHALRAAVQHHRWVGYVFAGSKTALLTDMIRNPERPFYRLGTAIHLGPVPREAFRPWLADRFRRGGFEPEAEGIDAILEYAADVPYNVQALAAGCWDALRDAAAGRLTRGVVDGVVGSLARREDPFYTALWTDLSPLQRSVLVVVLREMGRELLSHAVRSRHGLGAASSVQAAIAALETKSVLRREEIEGAIAFRFEDPFFRVWLERVLEAR